MGQSPDGIGLGLTNAAQVGGVFFGCVGEFLEVLQLCGDVVESAGADRVVVGVIFKPIEPGVELVGPVDQHTQILL